MSAAVSDFAATIAERIEPECVKQLTLDLVRIRSHPGEERPVSEFYAEYLRGIGLRVEMDDEFPDSPSVVARLVGAGPGPTLQLDGHTDTIELPGPEPRFEDGFVYGRGAEDMKGALAAMAEAARVVAESGVRLNGDVLLTAHGRHESSTNETLEALCRKGTHGDAAIVTELGGHNLPLVGLGLGFWDVRIDRDGDPVHENLAPPGTPNPVLVGHRVVELLLERSRELAGTPLAYVGPESIFVGQFHAGDFYNRLGVGCHIAGTRRFGPSRRLADARAELEAIARRVAEETGARIEVSMNGVDSFEISPEERIVQVVRRAHQAVTGRELPFAGTRTVANVPQFTHVAKIPAVYYGATYLTAHSDGERVELAELVRAARVYVHAILLFLGADGRSA